MDLKLDSPVQFVPRVGPAMAARLKKLNIESVNDLLWHAPFRYDDFSQVSHISLVRPGETVTLKVEVRSIANVLTKRGKRMQVASVSDDTGKIEIIWFNQPYLLNVIRKPMILNLAGAVQWFGRKLVIVSPDYEIVDPDIEKTSLNTGRLVPVYPETEGVSSKWLRGRIAYLIEQGLADLPDYIPENIKSENHLLDLSDAIKNIHYPKSKENAIRAKYRLAFGELLELQLMALEKRRLWQQTQKAHLIPPGAEKTFEFIKNLPFSLTKDQNRSIAEITADMNQSYPMNRLLEGDVGSGKTVVAAVAMFNCYLRGLSSVLMAPTQILAEQHFKTVELLFKLYKIPVKLVTSETQKTNVNKMTDEIFETNEKKSQSSRLSHSSHSSISIPTVYVGTHALLSKTVSFGNVGLIVIDEQQRFGVAQRELLRQKSSLADMPHLLAMTATPIPRTLALAVLGDLDLSVISQMPLGRKTIKTWVVPNEKRTGAYDWIRKEIQTNNSQIFVVCPLIEESETLADVKSVTKEFDRLKKEVFPDLSLALLHGRLKPQDKTQVLDGFQNHKFQILVTTPVVEVGIDIPGATIMVIEAAERFGLSQLHQLRGRVGRRQQQAYCLLFTETTDERGIQRLKSLENTHNGPQLAEIDLKFRGPGEVFGTRQHGIPPLKFADIFNTELLTQARTAANTLIGQSPDLSDFPLLSEKLKQGIITKDELSN
jgi:ATP-dependent DNA helicase RecG